MNSLGSVGISSCLLTSLRVFRGFSGSYFWSPSNVDFENRTASYFISKTGLFGNFRGIAIQDKLVMVNRRQVWRAKGRGTFFYRDREGVWKACYKQKICWSEFWVESVVAFHWLSWTISYWLGYCYCQAGKKNFHYPAVVLKKAAACWKCHRSLFLLGLQRPAMNGMV